MWCSASTTNINLRRGSWIKLRTSINGCMFLRKDMVHHLTVDLKSLVPYLLAFACISLPPIRYWLIEIHQGLGHQLQDLQPRPLIPCQLFSFHDMHYMLDVVVHHFGHLQVLCRHNHLNHFFCTSSTCFNRDMLSSKTQKNANPTRHH